MSSLVKTFARRRPAWLASVLLHLLALQGLVWLAWDAAAFQEQKIAANDAPINTPLLDAEPDAVTVLPPPDRTETLEPVEAQADRNGGAQAPAPLEEILTPEPAHLDELAEVTPLPKPNTSLPDTEPEKLELDAPATLAWVRSSRLVPQSSVEPAHARQVSNESSGPVFLPASTSGTSKSNAGTGTGAGSGTGTGTGTEGSGRGAGPAGTGNTSNAGSGSLTANGRRGVKPVYTPGAEYPREARRLGLSGTVVLNLEVLATGLVGKIELAQSSGSDVLDRAALDAARQWRFQAAEENGVKVATRVRFPHTFVLR